MRKPISMLVLALLITVALTAAAQHQLEKTFLSPDGRLKAKVKDTDVYDPRYRESVVSVSDANGSVLSSHDFTSRDRQHGAGMLSCSWSPDGQYFVVHMVHTGGHQPEFDPIVVWSLRTKRLYELINYTAYERFSLTAPDRLAVSTWPGLKHRTTSLHSLKSNELRELK